MIALYEDEKMNWWIRFWLQRCESNLETSRDCTVRFFDKCWYNNELGYDFYIVLMIAPYEDEKMYCWIRFWLQRRDLNFVVSWHSTVRLFDKCWHNNELDYGFYIVRMIVLYEDEKMNCQIRFWLCRSDPNFEACWVSTVRWFGYLLTQ